MNRRDTSFTRRIGAVVLIAVGAWLIVGCSTATSQSTQMPPSTALTERADNTTVRVHAGQILQLTLRNLYWSDPVSTSTGVLALDAR